MEEECSIWIKNDLKLSEKVFGKLTNSECGFTNIEEFLALNEDDLVEVARISEMTFGYDLFELIVIIV